ncbi:MAG: tRNA (cytidine(56)-2'-O)-methyltransferase [Halobacteriaceae archaeon]
MPPFAEIAVLRLGHRPGRDERMTTHIGLTSRALGADRVIFPTSASDSKATITDITNRFGGEFSVELSDSLTQVLDQWNGNIAHLTMYGERIQDIEDTVRNRTESTPLLIIVGAEKVPFEIYNRADWNIAVTNQPHSEVAALGVFLDHLYQGDELDQDWPGASERVVPQKAGKKVESEDS